MKFIVIGKQCSGKFEVLDRLEKMGVGVGREFTTDPNSILYGDAHIQEYSYNDVNSIFETGAYLYIKNGNEMFFSQGCRGMSQYDYDNADVIALTPDCISLLNKPIIQKQDVVVVWLDNNRDQRIHRFIDENRKYDFKAQDIWEDRFDKDLVDFACSHKQIYFFNEDPARVACVIKAIITVPELLDLFVENYK